MLQKSNFLFGGFVNFSRFFGYCFFASLPFNVGILIFSKDVYFSGFFNPFLSQFLYLGDVFLILSALFLALGYLFGQIEKFYVGEKKIFILLMTFLFTMVLSLVVSVDFTNSLFYFLRFLEFLVVYFLIVGDVVKLEKLLLCFIAAMSVASLIGILQYVFQSSLGLKFLGEPLINSAMTGVAKFHVLGSDLLRSYGTFPHPNLFGAYLVLAILFSVSFVRKEIFSKKALFLAIGLCSLALVFTFSRGAFLALFIGLMASFFISKTKFPRNTSLIVSSLLILLLLIRPAVDQGLQERLLFLDISWKMFFHNVLGVGIGNFTGVMQNYTNLELLPWNFQPVHNAFLLVLNEMGFIGLVSFSALISYCFWLIFNRISDLIDRALLLSILCAICVFGLFDHYLISLHQGQALLFLTFAMFAKYSYAR